MQRHIKSYYGLKVYTIEMFGNSQTADIYKIISDSGSYILKSHLNEQTAANEFYCLEALSKINLSARPLFTVSSSIYFKHGGLFYILMTYISTRDIKKTDLYYFKLGKAVKTMHYALSNLKLTNVPDRFDEEQLINNIKSDNIKKLIEQKYNDYKNYTSDNSSIIHGDLGVWNLLMNDYKINIIDFGEVRYGDPFFDLAALTESLNLNDTDIINLLHGYEDSSDEASSRLTAMRKKWKLRGIIFLAVNELKTEQELYDILT